MAKFSIGGTSEDLDKAFALCGTSRNDPGMTTNIRASLFDDDGNLINEELMIKLLSVPVHIDYDDVRYYLEDGKIQTVDLSDDDEDEDDAVDEFDGDD